MSRHLWGYVRSRHETSRILAAEGPPLTYLRAGMVIGAGSESFMTLRHLLQRLPVMIAPAWLSTATQPIAIDDAVAYLAQSADLEEAEGRRHPCRRGCRASADRRPVDGDRRHGPLGRSRIRRGAGGRRRGPAPRAGRGGRGGRAACTLGASGCGAAW